MKEVSTIHKKLKKNQKAEEKLFPHLELTKVTDIRKLLVSTTQAFGILQLLGKKHKKQFFFNSFSE